MEKEVPATGIRVLKRWLFVAVFKSRDDLTMEKYPKRPIRSALMPSLVRFGPR